MSELRFERRLRLALSICTASIHCKAAGVECEENEKGEEEDGVLADLAPGDGAFAEEFEFSEAAAGDRKAAWYDGNDTDGEADDGEDENGCCCAGVESQDDGDGAEEFGPGDAAGDVGNDRVGEDFKSFDAESEGL